MSLLDKGLLVLSKEILYLPKLKASADNKISAIEKLKLVLEKLENVGKGENASYQHFLIFQNVSRGFILRVIKSRDCVAKG